MFNVLCCKSRLEDSRAQSRVLSSFSLIDQASALIQCLSGRRNLLFIEGSRCFFYAHNTLVSLQEERAKIRKGEQFAIQISNIANMALFILKVYASVRSGSLAIIASTLDSLLDLLSGFILWFTAVSMRSPNPYLYPIGKKRMQPLVCSILKPHATERVSRFFELERVPIFMYLVVLAILSGLSRSFHFRPNTVVWTCGAGYSCLCISYGNTGPFGYL